MRSSTVLLSGLAALVLASPAAAEPASGLYGTVSAGVAFFNTLTGSAVTPAGSGPVTLNFNTGYSVNGELGWRFNRTFRLAGEYTYASASISSVSGVGGSGGSGNLNSSNFFVNAYYDFEFPRPGALGVYVGGGIGFSVTSLDGLNAPIAPTLSLSGNTTVFAYQARFGLSYNIADRVTLLLGYRFLGSGGLTIGGGGNQQVSLGNGSVSNIELGARFSF